MIVNFAVEILHRAKCDVNYLKQALGIKSDKNSEMHSICPFCGDESSFQFGPNKKRIGEYSFNCYRCGANGDVLAALNLIGRMPMRSVLKKIQADFTGCKRPTVPAPEDSRESLAKTPVLWPIF